MRDLIGRTLGHYRIVDKIGEGGMGEVYRAHDERLDRDVAVKVLPEEVAEKPDRLARFEREAKAVAKLNHPNILDVYELGDHEGRPYMATELLEGETLRERLSGTSLGWRKATEIGAAVADGLGAAHEAGICHRDLKPSNVFLTADGRIKVLDFGLARSRDAEADQEVTHAPTVTRYTDPGTVLGTVGYMSPEQVRGESVDQRSDIFSLGCVLYEMVSGQRAFTGDSAVETMNAILKEEPSDISTSGVELPPELAGTIRRCLEKRPQSRFQSASDLAYNLRTISSASTPSAARDVPSQTWRGKRRTTWIAATVAAVLVLAVVLVGALRLSRDEAMSSSTMGVTLEWVAVAPFENRTGDASLDPLGQRAVDLIIHRFSEVGMSDGVLTMDAVPFPPGGKSQREAPRRDETGVQPVGEKGPHAMVSGSYYLDGEDLEFQARLTDYETGELLYACKPVSATRLDSAEALDDLRERIVAAVGFHWNNNEDIRLQHPPSSYDALVEYRRGLNRFGSDYEAAVEGFTRALELDPDFQTARQFLIVAYFNLGENENAAREISAAEKIRQNFTEFERTGLDWCVASLNGRRPESYTLIRQTVKMAPQIAGYRFQLAYEAYRLNRPNEAIEVLGPILPTFEDETSPWFWWAFDDLMKAYHSLKDYKQELDWANKSLQIYPDVGTLYFRKGAALAAMGRLDAVQSVIDDCGHVQLRESAMNAGVVMAYVALELRAHGHRGEGDELADRAADWYDHQMADLGIGSRDESDLGRHSFVLRVAGRWAEARTPLAELEDRNVRSTYVAGSLGVIAAAMGDHTRARRIFDEMPESDSPFGPAQQSYWRACIASYFGEKDRAIELLKESYASGRRYGFGDHIDVDLEPLWDYPPYQELIAPKG
jgi:serine/threonine protein kinase/tetratricopeptide (TPR) repeat protein